MPRRAGAASPGRPCCRRTRRSGAKSISSHGSVRRAISGMLREVVDLAERAPRVARELASGALGADHREHAAGGERAPESRVRARAHAAAVRRDHERDARVLLRAVPRRQRDVGLARCAVVRAVVDRPGPHLPHARLGPVGDVRPDPALVAPRGRGVGRHGNAATSATRTGRRSTSLPRTAAQLRRLALSKANDRQAAAIEPLRPERSIVPVAASKRAVRLPAERDRRDPLSRPGAAAAARACAARRALGASTVTSAKRVVRLDRERDRAEARRGVRDGDPPARREPRARRRVGELEPVGGLVHEQQPQRLEERGVGGAVRRQVHRALALAGKRRDARGLAGDERAGRHRRRELAVEAEHELVGLAAVGEEARDVDPVDLVGAARRGTARRGRRARRRRRGRARAGASRAAACSARRPLASALSGREEAGGERVGHDEVPVAARARLGQRAVRPPRRRAGGPGRRASRRAAAAATRAPPAADRPRAAPRARRQRGGERGLARSAAHASAIPRSPAQTTACECRP